MYLIFCIKTKLLNVVLHVFFMLFTFDKHMHSHYSHCFCSNAFCYWSHTLYKHTNDERKVNHNKQTMSGEIKHTNVEILTLDVLKKETNAGRKKHKQKTHSHTHNFNENSATIQQHFKFCAHSFHTCWKLRSSSLRFKLKLKPVNHPKIQNIVILTA